MIMYDPFLACNSYYILTIQMVYYNIIYLYGMSETILYDKFQGKKKKGNGLFYIN